MRILGFRRRPLPRPGRLRRSVGLDWLELLVWLVAFIVVWVALGSSGTTYDVARTGYGLMFIVALLVGLPFVLVLTRPLTGLVISVGSAFALNLLLPAAPHAEPWSLLVVHGLVIFVLLFVTCARETLLRAIYGWLVTVWLFYTDVPASTANGWAAGVTIIAVLGLLVGRLVTTRRALAAQEEVSSAEKARRMVLEERASIARDLHDIVAHHMSLVVVQAETATYRVPDLSASAQSELLSIGETARSALTETRALLSVLRQPDQQVLNAPQPGLEQITELVDAARRAGVRIEAEFAGDLGVLRPGGALAVYRIAQEALANASRHAPGAAVELKVRAGAEGVWLRLVNALVAGSGGGGVGHGITGMRERAAAAGGQLSLGSTEDGLFVVELFLPLEPTEPIGGPLR